MRVKPEFASGDESRETRVLEPLLAGARVRTAGVGEDRLHLAALHNRAVVDDRRGGDLVRREDCGRRARRIGDDQRDVVAPLVLDFRRDARRAEPLCGTDATLDFPADCHLRYYIKKSLA